jgi:hypothetical protein
MRASFVLLTKHYSNGQVEEDDMGGACDTYGGEKKCTQSFGERNLKETTWNT